MAKETLIKDEMEQVEALEQEAQEDPDPSVFTRRLNKPFTYENTIVGALHFDFRSLSGEDTIAIEAELNHRLKNLMYPHHSWEFMTMMAVRACATRDANGMWGAGSLHQVYGGRVRPGYGLHGHGRVERPADAGGYARRAGPGRSGGHRHRQGLTAADTGQFVDVLARPPPNPTPMYSCWGRALSMWCRCAALWATLPRTPPYLWVSWPTRASRAARRAPR